MRQFVNNVCSPLLIKRYDPDIVHGTYYLAGNNLPAATPYVITVFDMIHERYPGRMATGEEIIPMEKKKCMQRADQVICISEHTRQDVIELAGIPVEKTTVIPLGCSFPLSKASVRDKSAWLDRIFKPQPQPAMKIIETSHASGLFPDQPFPTCPYLLYVGTRGKIKNFRSLLRAIAQSDRLTAELCLVCFGGGAFNSEELHLIQDLRLKPDQMIQVSGGDRVLENLYSHAMAMIYPSLYEGFGLPVLEAMACDCPVLCSNTSSMPEVAGQAALFFNPCSIDELTARMEEIVYSPSTRERLVRAGRERVSHFSWNRCANETVKVYKRCR